MRATLKQIATLTGVHRSTVDKVLHSREGVSDSVRARVQQVIDELDYHPNAIGKALAQQKHPKVIAVLLLQVDARREIQAGIERAFDECRSFAMHLEFYTSHENDVGEQLSHLILLQEKKIDGLVIMPVDHPDIVQAVDALIARHVPVMTVNTDLPGSQRRCFVGQNSVRAGRTAGVLLGEILSGRGKVAQFTSSSRLLCSVDRQSGFEAVLRERYPDLTIIDTLETHEDPEIAFRKSFDLLSTTQDLDALFIACGNVREIGRALSLVGRDHPLKIVSFDLYPEVVELVRSGVINFTIGQNLTDQGYRSLKMMFELIFYNKQPESVFYYTATDIRLCENVDET